MDFCVCQQSVGRNLTFSNSYYDQETYTFYFTDMEPHIERKETQYQRSI